MRKMAIWYYQCFYVYVNIYYNTDNTCDSINIACKMRYDDERYKTMQDGSIRYNS